MLTFLGHSGAPDRTDWHLQVLTVLTPALPIARMPSVLFKCLRFGLNSYLYLLMPSLMEGTLREGSSPEEGGCMAEHYLDRHRNQKLTQHGASAYLCDTHSRPP